ncbi:hypothetical protein CcrBL47_gp514 [Caulobacter phage BL47]|nr:hypothetical protein CcrBL47_gp514 [Caulobacter phage BL47]UTU10354.1 hypothetical protein CcrRB23_gp492 [Caulobacter phage RB23]
MTQAAPRTTFKAFLLNGTAIHNQTALMHEVRIPSAYGPMRAWQLIAERYE